MREISIHDLVSQPDSEPVGSTPQRVEGGWPLLRVRILAALEEDPLNTARLARHLDHQDAGLVDPHERVMSCLVGLSPGPDESRRLLERSLEARELGSRQRGRPVPLRLALLDLLMAENRERVDPWLTELQLSTGLARSKVTDPVQAATSMAAITGELQAEMRRARRFNQRCALLRVGLDDWQDLAWRAGAAAAERALGAASMVIKNEIRDVDWAARTPDQDLVIFLADTGHFGALLVANRVIGKLRGLRFPGAPADAEPRASIGVAVFPDDARFGWELVTAARNAMYRARADGGGGISDQGLPSARRFIRAATESVRIVVRTLNADLTGDLLEPPGDGIIFTSPVSYNVGSDLELECIELCGQGRTVLAGRVVRLEARVDGEGFDVGVACHIEPDEAGFFRERASRQSG
jgi:diguanylate cyclase (GGDEF)-like protein